MSLKGCCDALREIIAILGPIRVDSEEGANGLKVMLESMMLIDPDLGTSRNNFLHLHEEGRKGETSHLMQIRVKPVKPRISLYPARAMFYIVQCLGFTLHHFNFTC